MTCNDDICPLREVLCLNNISNIINCNDINNVYLINGIPGLKYSQFRNNLKSMYMKEEEINKLFFFFFLVSSKCGTS